MNYSLTNTSALLTMTQWLRRPPPHVVRLAQLAVPPDGNRHAVADAIRLDVALAHRLQFAANAVVGAKPVHTVDEAVQQLGSGLIVAVAFAQALGPEMTRPVPAYELSAGQLWRHSLAAAIAAETLLQLTGNALPPETIPAALLHDVGKRVLSHHASAEAFECIRRAREQAGVALHVAEREALGLHHAELGGWSRNIGNSPTAFAAPSCITTSRNNGTTRSATPRSSATSPPRASKPPSTATLQSQHRGRSYCRDWV